MSLYADAANLSEDDRIKLIGETAMKMPNKRIAFVTDRKENGQIGVKGMRYKRKLLEQFPMLTIKFIGTGPTPGAESWECSYIPKNTN